MSTVATLKAMIVADASGLIDGLNLTKKELRETAAIVERFKTPEQKLLDSRAALSRKVAGGLSADLAAQELKRREAELGLGSIGDQLAAKFSAVAGAITPATFALTGLATAFATATAAGIGLFNLVTSRLSAIDELGDAAERLGVSASSLSQLHNAAFLGDVEPGTVDSLVQKMLVNIGKEDEAFGNLGLSVEKLRAMSPEGALAAISKAIGQLPTTAQQFAAITDIFGKSGPEAATFIRRFDELNQMASETGATLSDELATSASKSDEAMKRLSLSVTGFGNSLAGVSAGPLTTMLDMMSELLRNEDRLADVFANLGGLAGGAVPLPLGLGGVAGRMGGRAIADELSELRRQELANRNPIKAGDAIGQDLAEEEAALKRINDLELKRFDAVESMGRSLWEQLSLVGKTESERQHWRVEQLNADESEKEHLHWLVDTLRERNELEKEFADKRRTTMQAIDKGIGIEKSLRTKKEAIEGDFLDDWRALKAAGMDSPEMLDRLARRGAAALSDRGELRGPPAADKGTREAREAVLAAQNQREQVNLQKRMEDHLRRIADRDTVEVELIHD